MIRYRRARFIVGPVQGCRQFRGVRQPGPFRDRQGVVGVGSHRQGGGSPVEAVADGVVVLVLAGQDADGVGMGFPPQPVINQRHVEVEFSCVLRLELSRFEFDDDVAQLLYVEEDQVNVEVITAYIEMDLPSDEGEARPQFAEGIDDAVHECLLEVSLGNRTRQPEKFKVLGIFSDFLNKFRLLRSKLLRKV